MKQFILIVVMGLFHLSVMGQYSNKEEKETDIKHGVGGQVGCATVFDHSRHFFDYNVVGGFIYQYQYNNFLAEVEVLYNRQLSVPFKCGFTTRSKKYPKCVHPFFLAGINLFLREQDISHPDPKILANLSFLIEAGINIPIYKNMHLFIKQKGHASIHEYVLGEFSIG